MNTRSIAPIVALVLALPVAVWLGVSVAQEQIQTVIWIMGALFLTLCLVLRQHVWILIPATLGLRGDINFIPGTPAPWILMTAAASGFTLLRVLSRQQPLSLRWTSMETALLFVFLTILQALLRNPVGFGVLGADVVGGKVYVEYLVAFVAYFTIAVAKVEMKSFRWAILAYIAVTFVDGVNAVASAFLPGYAEKLVRIYSNVSYEAAFATGFAGDIQEERISQFAWLAQLLICVACSFWRPLGALDVTKPWRGVTALMGVALAVLSGFRNLAVSAFVYFAVGSLIRRKFLDVVIACLVGGVVLVGVITTIQTTSLPFSIQRVLTIIPGVKVREEIKRSAESSSEGRFEVWRQALLTDRWIANKALGDGFQFSAQERDLQLEIRTNSHARVRMSAEDIMLSSGAYHGFHAETIRCTGVVGLIAATVALFVFFAMAMRHVSLFRNTPEWGFVLFLCIPFLIHPFWHWLVFGDYKQDFPLLLAQAGLLKVLFNIRTQPDLSA